MHPSSEQSGYSTDKAERLEARLSRLQKELIQHAAELEGRSVTDFVVSASQEAAKSVIRDHQIISLTVEESNAFANMLLGPATPNAKLKKAAKHYDTFMEKGDE